MTSFLGLGAEWWAIIISSIAFVVAIFKDFIKPWIFAPKLILEGKNLIFYIEETENLTKHRYLRLKIKNLNGFFTSRAENCYVKLIEIKIEGTLMHPFTPTPLKWSLYDEETDPLTKRKHNLARGEAHFIDLCYESQTGKKRLRFQSPIPPKLLEKLIPGRYTFKVCIYGDNFTPWIETFNVKYTDNFGELEFLDEIS